MVKKVIGLVGGKTLVSLILAFSLQESDASAITCSSSGVSKIDCDNPPTPVCKSSTYSCACGGTVHQSHLNQIAGPCGSSSTIVHTPDTHTNFYYSNPGKASFLKGPGGGGSCGQVAHTSSPGEHLMTHIEHTSTGGHISYVETLSDELYGTEGDSGLSATGEIIEDIDTSTGEDSWCVHKNACYSHSNCAHCSHSNHSNHANSNTGSGSSGLGGGGAAGP